MKSLANSLRGAARGDDLVGGAADQFRHVIESEGEGARARGRRADFDDQVANFGFRHFGPHHVPAVPALARVEAEDMAAAAGPKGRDATAATDVTMRAEILSYSRARGLFAGISLEGSTLRPDNDANEKLYGKKVTATEIIRQGAVPIPASGRKLVSLLEKKSPKNHSDPESLK